MNAAVRGLARAWPWPVDPSDELRRALATLPTPLDAATVTRAGYVAGFPVAVAAVLGGRLVGVPWWGLLSLGLGGWLAATHSVHRAPVVAAAAWRTRAAGEAGALVTRAVLGMTLEPAPERAAAFAARTGHGPLSASLAAHVRRARGSAGSGLDGFAAEWSEWFPALERSLGLVVASGSAGPDERRRLLDRALSAVLDGTRERMAAFGRDIRGPVTAVYAFGVLLPLALVGILPAARVAGVHVSVSAVVLAYDVVLPALLVAAGVRLLLRRPVAFPPPRVSRSHPDVPGRWRGPLAGVLAGVVAGAAAGRLVAPWTVVVAGVGTGVGTALAVHYRPVKSVRGRVRAAERRLDDALYLVGRRVADGESVETALSAAAGEVDGETGATLAAADEVRKRLRTTVHDAFLGPHGALADLPSPRFRSAAALLAVAAREGAPAGDAVVTTAKHLGELCRVEAAGRRGLARVTGTLANTAAVFGPLVAGATVSLSGSVAAGPERAVGRGLSAAELGPAVGVYVLLMAAILTVLSTGLDRGLDPALVGYRVGLALPAATATYLAAVVGTGLVL